MSFSSRRRYVQGVTAQQDFFLTPYADVDMAAMAHRGLDNELAAAFHDGKAAAQQLLGRSQRSTPAAPGVMAWPTGGVADYGVLEELAAQQRLEKLRVHLNAGHIMHGVVVVPGGDDAVACRRERRDA